MKSHKGVYEKVKGSGIWWVRWTDTQGTRRKKKVGSFGNAVKVYEQRSSEAKLGVLLPNSSKIHFSEIAEDAIVYAKSHHRSSKDFEQRLRMTIPVFGPRIATSITTGELQHWMDKTARERNWTPGTINRVKSGLSTTFREAMRVGKVAANPARLLRRAKEPLGRLRFLSSEEEERLRASVRNPLPLLQMDVALHTGMRLSEQFTATWDQVDLERGFIYLSITKNGSDRYVHLNTKAKAALETLQRRGLGPGDCLFVGTKGRPIRSPKKWFETATRRAEIEGVTWHTLRHTFASRLVMAGVDLKTVQELMGHKSITMTARYAHLAPAHKLAALEKLV